MCSSDLLFLHALHFATLGVRVVRPRLSYSMKLMKPSPAQLSGLALVVCHHVPCIALCKRYRSCSVPQLTHTTDLHHIYTRLATGRLFAWGGVTHRCGVSWVLWVGVRVEQQLRVGRYHTEYVSLCIGMLMPLAKPVHAVPSLLLRLLLPTWFSY